MVLRHLGQSEWCLVSISVLVFLSWSAFEYLTRAAALGNAAAHYGLSILYEEGVGVEKDEKKELHHLEEAATGGHLDAKALSWK